MQAEKAVVSASKTEGTGSGNLIVEVTSYHLSRVSLIGSQSLLATDMMSEFELPGSATLDMPQSLGFSVTRDNNPLPLF